jgi:hypothetical protein
MFSDKNMLEHQSTANALLIPNAMVSQARIAATASRTADGAPLSALARQTNCNS